MIEKALIVIIFMYAASFGMLGAQYMADAFGFTMTSLSGVPIKSNVLALTDVDTLNTIGSDITDETQFNQTAFETDPVSRAGSMAWSIFQIITGTYIFNILLLFDVPVVIVGGIILIYVILLVRAIIAYLRGI